MSIIFKILTWLIDLQALNADRIIANPNVPYSTKREIHDRVVKSRKWLAELQDDSSPSHENREVKQ